MTEGRKVITVDGLAGSGKSTLARLLAERLGFVHFSSGLHYRAIGYLALREGLTPEFAAEAAKCLERHRIQLRVDGGLLIDGAALGDELYQPRVSEMTSKFAALPEVRSALVRLQRDVFPGCPLVAEGRDMGTVIFPDANIKFFIEASCEVRVRRRLAQLGYETYEAALARGLTENELNSLKKDIEIEIIERDARDCQRAIAPTVAAADAVTIDNSSQTLTQVVQCMYDAVASRGLIARASV